MLRDHGSAGGRRGRQPPDQLAGRGGLAAAGPAKRARLSVAYPTLPVVSDSQTAPEHPSRLDVVPPPDEGEPRGPAISPSRAGDFMTCPLLYRFRVIDRLPEPPSPAAARGTLVHAVLERLFDRPAAERTPQLARSLAGPEWDRLVEQSPELAALFTGEPGREEWTAEVAAMLDRYFTMEDPQRIEPAERELYVETTLESGLRLRGYVDRLDVASGGAVRIVDYKTGTAPREEFEARALFQMKFYALVLWRIGGAVPRLLQLMYLGNGEILRYQPDEADLRATERKVLALWRAIERARESGDWRPRPSRVCDWCAHKPLCPAFGGTPPPLPAAQPVPAAQPAEADPLLPAPAEGAVVAEPARAVPAPPAPPQASQPGA
jgi:putative RecB family exonuclease